MKTKVITCIVACFLVGCAASTGVGSNAWYKARIQEIEDSYSRKEISSAEYIRLKNETDAIRTSHKDSGGVRTGLGFQYGVFR